MLNNSFCFPSLYSMKLTAFALPILVVFCFLSSCKKEDDIGGTPIPPPTMYDFTAVGALMESYEADFNGAVLLAVMRDDSLIYEKQIGQIGMDSRIPVASVSKWVSGAVLLALDDAGILDINAPVADHLPAFDSSPKNQITPLHCFSIQSGLRECSVSDPDCLSANNDITLQEVAALAGSDVDMVASPGTALYYGGLSMEVAAAAAEVASGKDWESLLLEYITRPCEMTQSDFGNLTHPKVAAGLRTTASDYLNFLSMVRNGGMYNGQRVLSEAAVETMFTPWTLDKPVIYSPYPQQPPYHPYNAETVYYGFGGWMDVIDPMTGEVIQMSSPGGLGSYPYIDRSRNLAVVIITLSSYTEVVEQELEIIQAIREAVDAYDQ